MKVAESHKNNLKRRLKKQSFLLLLPSFYYKHWTLKRHLREKICEFTIKFGFFHLFFDDGSSDSNYLRKYAYRFKPRVINSYFLYGLVAPNYGLLPPNDSFFRANDSLLAANHRSQMATLAVVWKKLRFLQSWVKAWTAPAIPYYIVETFEKWCGQ